MTFDAGALAFKIQAVGAQAFRSDLQGAKTAIEGVDQASSKAKTSADGLGKSTDDVADKARKTKQPLEEQAKAAKGAGTESETAAEKQRKQKQASEEQAQAAQKVGAALLVMGAAIGSGVALAVARFADFDQQMSNVQAATGESAEQMGQLREAAIDAGSSTVFSATEAAGAIEELSKAGVATADILSGALTGSLDLAAAGQLQVARAAEITSTALNQFGLSGGQASHVADVLAAGAGKAMGSVDDLANGLKFVGPVAASMGVSLEETTGVLALFAQQGIMGEQAGTSLRGVLSSLTSPSKEARAEIERLGIQIYDSQGNFLGLQNAAGQLSKAYSTMDGASRDASLGVIFGRETVTAATALYRAGAQGVAEWTAAVDDSGYAAEQARARLDNLAGDVEALGGAFDSALIQAGSGANDALRSLVQIVTDAVTGFSDLPEPVQQTALYLAAAAAGVGLVGGAALVTIPKIAEMRTSLDTLGVTGERTRAGLGRLVQFIGGPWGVAMLAATAATVAFNAEIDRGVPSQEKIANAAQESASAMDMLRAAAERGDLETNLWGDYAAQLENLPGLLDRASEAGWRWAELNFNEQGALDSVKRLGDALGHMAATNLPAAQSAFGKLRDEFGLTDEQAAQLLDEMPALKNAMLDQATAAGIVADDQTLLKLALGDTSAATEQATGTAQSAAGAYLEAANGAGSLQDELTQLISTIMEANGVGQDAVSANIDYQNALAKVDENIQKAKDGVEGYSLSLDQGTQVGRDNLGMLNDLASSSQNAADKQFALDGNTQNYRSSLEAGRQALIDRAMDLGYNAEQAGALADQVYRIPTEREVDIIAETQAASEKAQAFANLWESIKNRTVTLTMIGSTQIGGGSAPAVGPLLGGYGFGSANGNFVEAYANGGIRENHVAQMARAGAMRVWSEPETMGETYVPHAEAKRSRSEQLMSETASLFGGQYISRDAVQSGRAGGGAVPSISVPITVHGTPGMNVEQLASRVQARVIEAIERKLR